MRLVISALAVGVARGCIPSPQEGWRLIRLTEDTKPLWVSADSVASLSSQRVGFIDITGLDFCGTTLNATEASYPSLHEFTHRSEFDSIMQFTDRSNFLSNLQEFTSFHDRRKETENGRAASMWLYDLAKEYAAPCDASVELWEHQGWNTPSVIVKMRGASNTSEVLIWGSHLDSTSFTSDEAPGADDNATGSMTVLEGMKAACASDVTFHRDVEFHFYGAEEGGLFGSQDIACSYGKAGVDVKAMMQHDMTCWNPEGHQNYNAVGIVEDHTNANLNAFIADVVSEYTYLRPIPGGRCGFGCSDHASWSSRGYPAAFPFEKPAAEINPNIHTEADTLDKCDVDFMAEFIAMGVGYLVELALE